MFTMALRQIRFEWGRTVFVCLAIAASIALILVLEGFQQGLFAQLHNVVTNRGGQLIVTQAGVRNFVASRSVLPQMSRAQIEAIEGVEQANPMTLVPVIFERHGRKTPIFFTVYDTLGGPARLVAGKQISGPRQIVIDQSLVAQHDLKLGDQLVISGFAFTIVGLTRQAAAMFTSFSFITYDDLLDFYFESDIVGDIMSLPLVSFYILELTPGAEVQQVRRQIEAQVPEVDVFLPQELAGNDENLGRTLFGPVMAALISISYLICLLVIGIIMFAAIYARRRCLGVLKALGFATPQLALTLLLEAFMLTALAIPLGFLLAELTGWLVESMAPLYLIKIMTPLPVIRTILAAFALAAMGALLPVRLIAGLEPAMVFRT